MKAELLARLQAGSRIPAILAPMYRVSGPELVIAGCRAGMISALAAQSTATVEELAQWFAQITAGLAAESAPAAQWGVSMVAHSSYQRFDAELALIEQARPAFVVTALGSPRRAMAAVHGYGGAVFADVASVDLARKAADAGADGLVLVCGGAGGQTGTANPFAFVEEVRSFYDGIIALAGAIATGHAVRAAQVMGADLAYVGTHFIPAHESLASPAYKQAVLGARLRDIVTSDVVTGVAGTFTRQSLLDAGFDPEGTAHAVDFTKAFDGAPPPRAFSAGHGAGASHSAASAEDLIDRLAAEYAAA